MTKSLTLQQGKILSELVITTLNNQYENILVVGSVRRKENYINSIDIICVEKVTQEEDLLGNNIGTKIYCTTQKLEEIKKSNIIVCTDKWGKMFKSFYSIFNKDIKINIDITTKENLVCKTIWKTGPEKFCKKLTKAAIKKGWKWQAGGPGIVDRNTNEQILIPKSETELLQFLGFSNYINPNTR